MKCIATLFLTITYQQILRHRFALCCHVNVTQIQMQMTVKVGISMKMMSMKYNLFAKMANTDPKLPLWQTVNKLQYKMDDE